MAGTYVIDYNDNGGGVKDYKGHVVTPKLLAELMEIDAKAGQQDGYLKFYLSYHEDDIDPEQFRMDLGDGTNEETFSEMQQAVEEDMKQMQEYGYLWEGMMPIGYELAKDQLEDLDVYLLYSDDTEGAAKDIDDLERHKEAGGLFGVEIGKAEGEIAMEKKNPEIEHEKKYIFLQVRKAFVRKDVTAKDGQRTYNQVTMPKNMEIDGKNIGGYMCYPLYINEDRFNDKVYNIPYQAGYKVRLVKGKESVEVDAEKLRDGLKASYKEWRMEQDKSGGVEPKEKMEAREMVRQGLLSTLVANKGEEMYPSDIRDQVRMYIAEQAGNVDALSYVKEHYDEALEVRKMWKEKTGQDVDVLTHPEAYYAQMADILYEEEIEKNVPLLSEERDEPVPILQRNINLIKKQITPKEPKKEKSKDIEME